MGITKNIQSREAIEKMIGNAFPEKEMTACAELSEGLCNIAYRIEFSDGSKSILKIAPQYNSTLLRNEKCLMNAEVNAMKLAENIHGVRTAKVQYYDTSKALCTGDYFIMEYLEGESLVSLQDKLSEEERYAIYSEVGSIVRDIAQIKGEHFGQLYNGAESYDKLWDFLRTLIRNVLADAKEKEIVIGVSPEEILSLLEAHKAAFEDVSPVLVHYDLWEGNIFVKDGHVCALIDWERALWGDVLMEDRFRRHSVNDAFLRGFGQTDFSKAERIRILWYDIVLYLTMMTEGKFREYPDDSQYRWIKPYFDLSWSELRAM
ncbi:MAG: phosphotransferase family protein [Huintestinicola sp.]|uniref:phosphotransferase family protein n=1 Tax=Huintestinicola sp. TaxID=2981661 RepID=UPI003F0CDEAC